MKKIVDISYLASRGECSGLNIDGSNVGGVFSGNPIKSLGDGEMILNITFKEKVSFTHILFEGGMDDSLNPEYVNIYANRNDLDFSEIEDIKPTEHFDLNDNLKRQIKLNVPKFKNISSFSLYFKSEESDIIQVNHIKIFGNLGEKNVDFEELKKNPVS